MRKGDRVVVVGVSRQGGKTQQLIDKLRGDLDEALGDIEERDAWADSLASYLDVPGDLDPYFGIERVARTNVSYLEEATRECEAARKVLEAAGKLQTDLFESLVADMLAQKGLAPRKREFYQAALDSIRAFDAAMDAAVEAHALERVGHAVA